MKKDILIGLGIFTFLLIVTIKLTAHIIIILNILGLLALAIIIILILKGIFGIVSNIRQFFREL